MSSSSADDEPDDGGGFASAEPPLLVKGDALNIKPGPDIPLKRESTASHLGLGLFYAFAVALAVIAAAHGWTLWYLTRPLPEVLSKDPALVKDAIEVWFRARQQVADSVTSIAQVIGTLIAGPLGVVLGFYFRDRK